MKALVCAVLILALAGPGVAQSRYDRKLEAAAAAIVASRIGEMRGGFDFGVWPMMVIVRDEVVMGTTDLNVAVDAPPEGMVRAVERRTGPTMTF